MSKKEFYIFGIIFLALYVVFSAFQGLSYLQLVGNFYTLKPYPNWILGISFTYVVTSFFLLKYYQSNKYWFPLILGIIAVVLSVGQSILFYIILEKGKWMEYYLPVFLAVTCVNIPYGVSLIFSKASERIWLRVAGISITVISVTLLAVFWLFSFQHIQPGTLEAVNKWLYILTSLVPVLFIFNFWQELKGAGKESTNQPIKKQMLIPLGAVALLVSVFMLYQGSRLMLESGSIFQSPCDFSAYQNSESESNTYDSSLIQNDILPIERKLSTPHPSKEAKALYQYLLDVYGKKILSGQMSAPWGVDELQYIKDKTGKEPALRGIDFIHQRDNEVEVRNAIEWWNSGGIPTIMWHWGAPGVGEGYENSKEKIDIDKCFIEGTQEHTDFWAELKAKADLLENIRDADVPVLWRPFHELNGHWFWYGKQGPERFKKLWITMYDYFVHERGLNNLIWVLCYANYPEGNWFPGNQYVDISGTDTYDGCQEPHAGLYRRIQEIVEKNPMPIAYHECGVPPDPNLCVDEGAMWLWWMEWHTEHLRKINIDYLNFVYQHELVITKDEVPDIMKVYGE